MSALVKRRLIKTTFLQFLRVSNLQFCCRVIMWCVVVRYRPSFSKLLSSHFHHEPTQVCPFVTTDLLINLR